MSAKKGKGPVFDPGLCRCCGAIKKCRILNVEYESFGQKEVYSDMIMNCFGLFLSHLDGKPTERLICATCVQRVRDALSFKQQALRCEKAFLKVKIYDEGEAKAKDTQCLLIKEKAQTEEQKIEEEVKIELQEIEIDEDIGISSESPPRDALADDDESQPKDSLADDVESPPRDALADDVESPPRDALADDVESPPRDALADDVETPPRDTQADDDYDMEPEVFEHDSSNDSQIAERPNKDTTLTSNGDISRKIVEQPKIPMSKLQQRNRERDSSYISERNIVTIVEFSYACPFKNGYRHLLCFYCGDKFLIPELLRSHTLDSHNPEEFIITNPKKTVKIDLTRIDCRLCPERITTLDDFRHHISSVHNKKYYFNNRDLLLPFCFTNNEFKCALCDLVFSYFQALNKHMNEHFSNYVCETCGMGFVDEGRLIMHQQNHGRRKKKEGNFPCEVCGKVFKANFNRQLHVDTVHEKIGRVNCPKCDVTMMTYQQKLKHMVEVHGEEPMSFPCNGCDKVLSSRKKLTTHKRLVHLKDYRYECETCGQKFFTGYALRNHMPKHTGERNFKCKVCEKSYPRLKTLNFHMRIHTNDRRYRCHICGQAFIQNCSLKGHMKSQHPENS